MTYPITITRDLLIDADACKQGIAAFDQVAPGGTLTIPDVSAHAALLSSPLAPFEVWAIGTEIVPPIVVSVGVDGTASAGAYGTASAGDRGTASAGDRGTASAGDYGTATAGNFGAASVGVGGTATAGDRGIITIKWWDDATFRYRIHPGYVGEDGIKPNTPYRVEVEDGMPRFVEVTA